METRTVLTLRSFALILAFTLAVPAAAQNTITGTLEGRVLDASKAPIVDVFVQLTNLGSGFQYAARTDADGFYRVTLLPPARYRIVARKDGYLTGEIAEFRAEVATAKVITPPPITLLAATPGSSSPAPAGMPVQADVADATRRGLAAEEFLESLPLAGIRSFDTFALLVPGVAPAPETIGAAGAAGPGVGPGVGTAGQFSVNGARARSNNFTVDGSDNNDQDVGVRRQGYTPAIPQPIESITQFEITTHLADAEAGRNTGAQVNVVSRSGANDFHGTAYTLFTHDALNARDFFDLSGQVEGGEANPEENPFRRFQIGGAAGGPIVEDKLHLFGAFEYQDVDRTREAHFATPTGQERLDSLIRGGFASLRGIDILQPSFYPLPTTPGGPYGGNTLTRLISTPGRGILATGKLDYQGRFVGRSSVLTARYDLADDDTTIGAVDNALDSTVRAVTRAQNLALALNTVLSDAFSNQIRFSYGRTSLRFDEVDGSPFVFGAPAGAPMGDTGPVGRVVFAGYSSIGVDPFTFPQDRVNDTFQIADTAVFARGRNTLRFGGDLRRVHFDSRLDRNYRAQVTFAPVIRTTSRNDFVDEIATTTDTVALGIPANIFQALAVDPDSRLALRVTELNLFAHDALRASRRLALTFGLRYELNTVPKDATGRLERSLGLTLPAADGPAAEAFLEAFRAQQAVYGGRTEMYDGDHNNFAPRVGFALDLTGTGRAALRGGYGLYYDTILGTVVSQSRNVFPSFVPVNFGAGSVDFSDYLAYNPALLEYNGAPLIVPGTVNQLNVPADQLPTVLGSLLSLGGYDLAFTLPDRELRTPYVHQYSLTLEAALFDRYTASVAYVGSSARKLARLRTPNGGPFSTFNYLDAFGSVTVIPLFPSNVAGVRSRPNTALGPYTVIEGSANSRYDALQASLAREWRDGLTFQLAYTWSHAIDDVSDLFDIAGAPPLAQDELGRDAGLRAERADASFDVRHRFTAAWRYELPFWSGLELSGVATLQTGQPYTVNVLFDANYDGNLTDRPATTSGIDDVKEGPVRLRLAPGAGVLDFVRLGESGATGRNTFRAAGVANLDLALSKRWEFASQAVTARVEAFNLFNRAHFGVPVRTIGAVGFGGSTYTTVPARTIQLAVRYAF